MGNRFFFFNNNFIEMYYSTRIKKPDNVYIIKKNKERNVAKLYKRLITFFANYFIWL